MRPARRDAGVLALARRVGLDVALAAGLLCWTLLEVLLGGVHGPGPVAVTGGVLMTVPLAWRSRMPVPVGVLVTAAFFAQSRLGVDGSAEPSTIADIFVAAYAVGTRDALRRSALGALPMVVLAGAAMPTAGNVAFALLVVGGGWLVGRVVHTRREEARRLEQLAIERGVQARTAVLEERARIARELHDIVAHSVSVMVVQAGAAGEVLDRDPDRARISLELIQDSGHQALQELRRLLGVLRSDEGAEPLSPTPGLARLPELVQEFRGAGLAIEVRADELGTWLEPGVDLAAYRVAQEALTNALKHGGGTPVVLEVRHRGDGVVVSVLGGRDDRSRRRSVGPVTGHGLVGMRERVAACGGRLETGWEGDSRFVVRAWLPTAGATT